MKKRKVKIIVIIIASIILISLLTFAVDVIIVKSGGEPIFIISKDAMNDGGTKVYYGLGYQIIKWHRYDYEGGTQEIARDDIEFHYIFGIKRNP